MFGVENEASALDTIAHVIQDGPDAGISADRDQLVRAEGNSLHKRPATSLDKSNRCRRMALSPIVVIRSFRGAC